MTETANLVRPEAAGSPAAVNPLNKSSVSDGSPGVSLSTSHLKEPLTVTAAIRGRRSVRNFTPEKIKESLIQELLEASVYAPSAQNEEPWSFSIVQDAELLSKISYGVEERSVKESYEIPLVGEGHLVRHFGDRNCGVFYNAGTLMLICAKPNSIFAAADCWMAAENLMLAAFSLGLGTCVIGSAVPTLNAAEWKTALEIPDNISVFVPIIVGVPAGDSPVVMRKPPVILKRK